MEAHHRVALRRNLLLMDEKLSVYKVTLYLYQDNILSEDMVDAVLNSKYQIYELVRILTHRGPKAFQTFCHGLKFLGYVEILERIKKTAAEEEGK